MTHRRGIERNTEWLLLFLVSVAYLGGAMVLAVRRPLWNDELYTLLIADSPTMGDVWAALATGADQVPPPFHVITRASLALFGETPFGLRLPAVIGFWLMGIGIHRFVSRRISSLYALVAMSFPLVTGAYEYAHEGRSYALALGFAAVALASWQAAEDESRRRAALGMLAFSTAGAVCSHYYAVLITIPIAVGELARSVATRRLRLGVPTAIVLGLAPLVAFLPLIGAARSYSVNFWARADWTLAPITYFVMFIPAGPALWAAAALAAIYSVPRVAVLDPARPRARPSFAPGELAALLTFALLPVLAVFVGVFLTGIYTPRYSLPVVIGVAGLAGFGADWAFGGRRFAAIALILVTLFWFAGVEGRGLKTASTTTRRQMECDRLLAAAEPMLPIAVADPLTFLKLSYETPKEIARRIVYLSDPAAALRHLGHNTVDRGLVDLEPWFGVRVEPLRDFLQVNPSFLVLARTSDAHGEIWRMGWLIAELIQAGSRMELVARSSDDLLFRVTR
jgi:hypothetical protein